jgi:hypothetical protein
MFALRLFYQRHRKAIVRLVVVSAAGLAVFASAMPAPRADAAALAGQGGPTKPEIVRAGRLSPLLTHEGFERARGISLSFTPATSAF